MKKGVNPDGFAQGLGCAFLAITHQGVLNMIRLHRAMPEAVLYLPGKFSHLVQETPDTCLIETPVKEVVPQLFYEYRGLVLFMATGAAVRLLAPLLADKRTDPAVVVVDESARYAISLVSAHLGGANGLAERVARALQAHPVITTASDAKSVPAVDLLGKRYGWQLENAHHLNRLSAMLVNGELVGVLQESGSKDWWPQGVKPDSIGSCCSDNGMQEEKFSGYQMPGWISGISSGISDTFEEISDKVHFFTSLQAALAVRDKMKGWVVISHRLLELEAPDLMAQAVVYRPRSLVLGVGLSRGTSCEEIERFICSTLSREGLSVASVESLATIDLKQDEEGLMEVAQRYQWPVHFFSAQALNRVPIPHPSETVFRVTGTYGVSQPAAMLAARAASLLVKKVKSHNVTLSVALRRS